jgi:hypothetical protein
MSEDEVFITFVSIAGAVVGMVATRLSPYHALHLKGNDAIGVVRLAVGLAMAAITVSVLFLSDASVTGVYIPFYLVMGYAAVKLFGQMSGSMFGVRYRVDVCERRNFPAALFLASFVLATGIIFAGSVYGDADPTGDWEGGWWIPVGFFLLGWVALLVSVELFFWREPGVSRIQLRRDRDLQSSKAAAAYTVGTGIVIFDGVGGDFHGWLHGVSHVGVILLMLVGHEIFRGLSRGKLKGRLVESIFYLGFGFVILRLMRLVHAMAVVS